MPPSRGAIGKQGGINEHAAFDLANAFGGDILGELLDDRERIARQRGAVVGVIFIHEGERAVGLDAIGKIGIAAGDEDEIAFQRAVRVDRAGAIDARVKAIVGAEFGEQGAFGENFRGGGRDEQFVGVEGVEDFAGVERIELDAEIGVSEFGAAHHFLDALSERGFGLRADWRDWQREKEQRSRH